ncbi:MAG: NlpC/P60 family protein [Rhodanobacter sp.]
MAHTTTDPLWRDRVVAEVRSWVRTPYHHLADVKGVGVDCAMLTWRVFHDLELFDVPDPRPYPIHWHLHRSEERYLLNFETWAFRVEQPQPGDIALFRFGRTVSHSGILTTPTTMVHAYLNQGCWEQEVETFADRLHSYWSITP